MSSSTHLQFVTGSGSALQIPPFQRPHRSQKMLTVSAKSNRLNTFKHILKEGSPMRWEFFMSPEATKTSDSLTALLLLDSRRYKFDEIAETMNPLPVELFRFSDCEQLMLLTNTNTDLSDIAGEVRDIKTIYN
ncbi:hypothetical protein Bca101_092608 [Brassica carinata]